MVVSLGVWQGAKKIPVKLSAKFLVTMAVEPPVSITVRTHVHTNVSPVTN